MEFFGYLFKVSEILHKNHPRLETRTINDYLETIASVSPPIIESGKSLEAAEGFRNNGNLRFVGGNMEAAVELYTLSLRAATPYSVTSSLAYANRSAALYRLGKFKDCIADINRALNLPYPNNSRPKIIARKELAVAGLRNRSNLAEGRSGAGADELTYAHGENAKLPGLSLGIEIARIPEEGRGLVAKKAFEPGDVLVVDKPYIAVPDLKMNVTFCHHCLKTTICLIPCDQCHNRVYCSEACRTEAYKTYHRIECKILDSIIFAELFDPQTMIVSLNCLSILTEQGNNFEEFYKDFEEMKNNPDPTQLVLTEEEFVENKSKVILSLRTKRAERPEPGRLIRVAYIIVLLRNCTDFFKTDADIPRIAELLIELINICDQNSFQITHSGNQKHKAQAVFPLISLANHACSNNTIAYVDGNDRIVLRASQHIKPGAQIRYSFHYSTLFLDGIKFGTNRILECKRYCRKCDDTFVFPIQRESSIQIDKILRRELSRSPCNVENLWRLLKFLQEKGRQHTIQIQMVKVSLIEAYESRANRAEILNKLRTLGIL